jgi:15-cis-phytoene synthase
MTIQFFHQVSNECSKTVTNSYSTSFSSAIKLLHADLRRPVFNIYGFVRFADEIVDTFHPFDKMSLLKEFKKETYDSIERGISLNPILNSFQQTVRQFKIDLGLVEAFFSSMESDLTESHYNRQGYEEYIYGSAEVVGLMCLYVFCGGNQSEFDRLKDPAKALGAAFQKVNFLRDIKSDFIDLSRVYFPDCDFNNFSERDKARIEQDIENDFVKAYQGIIQLPLKSRFGVYVAYKYYYSLFQKIKTIPSRQILQQRVRVSNYHKAYIVVRAGLKNGLGLI